MQDVYYSDEDCTFIASKEMSVNYFPGCKKDFFHGWYRNFCDKG